MECTIRLRAGPKLRSKAVTGTPVQSCSAYQPEVQSSVARSRAPDAVDKGRWTFGYLMSRATTIGAGTAEIQRNTIAESVLGLPSHRGEGTRAAAVTPGAPLAVPEEDERELREVLAATLRAKVDEAALLDR